MGKNFVDKYTYLHFAVGIVVYYWDVSLLGWFIFHSLFELIENTECGVHFINSYLTMWPGGKPRADSMINSIGDTVGAMLGWLTAYYLDKYEYDGHNGKYL